MGLPILNHLLPQGLLEGIDVLPIFLNLCASLVLDMVASRLASHPILTQIILDLFSRLQVFHQKTLRIYVIILAIHYVVSLLNVDIEFL